MQKEHIVENTEDNSLQIAGFVAKTFDILNITDYNKIIYWSSNGLEFTIKDIPKFQEIVLPKYFRHNKINSFVRQLNMYGFHKTKHNNFKTTFKHPMFQKNHQHLLPLVKRKIKNITETSLPNNQYQQFKPITIASNTKKAHVIEKQPQVTSVSLQKYFNFNNEFVETTKLINLSLKKVSFNDFSSLQNLEEFEHDDCASIEDQLQIFEKQEDNNNYLSDFQNVSCFFSSGFNI